MALPCLSLSCMGSSVKVSLPVNSIHLFLHWHTYFCSPDRLCLQLITTIYSLQSLPSFCNPTFSCRPLCKNLSHFIKSPFLNCRGLSQLPSGHLYMNFLLLLEAQRVPNWTHPKICSYYLITAKVLSWCFGSVPFPWSPAARSQVALILSWTSLKFF